MASRNIIRLDLFDVSDAMRGSELFGGTTLQLSVRTDGVVAMANRFGRRRVDRIFEYSDSLEELQRSAIQENDEYLKEVLALVGLVLGAIMMYAFVGRHLPDWPKILRFVLISGGACLCGVVCARGAVLLRQLLPICFTLGVFVALGWLLWRVLW